MLLRFLLCTIVVQFFLAFKAWPTILFPRPDGYSILAAFLAPIPMFWIVLSQRGVRAFWLGGLSALALLTPPILYTTQISLSNSTGWIVVLAVSIFTFTLGGLFSIIGRMAARPLPWALVLILPAVVETTHFLRTVLAPVSGIIPPPIAMLAFPLTYFPPLIQMASFIGMTGVDFLVYFIAALTAFFTWDLTLRLAWLRQIFKLDAGFVPLPLRSLILAGGLSLALLLFFIGLFFAGNLEAQHIAKVQMNNRFITTALIQPNLYLAQSSMIKSMKEKFILKQYRSMYQEAMQQKAELVIFPEDLWDESLPDAAGFWQGFRTIVREMKCPTVAGMMTHENGRLYNTWYQLDERGEIINTYQKRYLIPFGEYIPLRAPIAVLREHTNAFLIQNYKFWKLEPISNPLGDVSPGKTEKLFNQNGRKYFLKICDEILLPQYAAQGARLGAEALFSPSSGEWFRTQIYHAQYLSATCFRAVETRRWIGRTASLGTAFFIDALGCVRSISPFEQPAVLVQKVPLISYQTFYTRFGDLFGWTCVALAGGFFCLGIGFGLFTRWAKKFKTS
jgi:apolipoprotein N-acyltransferase